MNSTATSNHSTTLQCIIRPEDFKEMRYFYDSGMFEGTTKNVAALALAKAIRHELKVQVKTDGHDGPYVCLIEDQKFAISRDLSDLFEAAERGIDLVGYEFQITIPSHYLANSESPQGAAKEEPSILKERATKQVA